MTDGTDSALPGPCVLIVEDEMQLVMMLEDLLHATGYRVLKAARLPAALKLAESEAIDAAILDINLAGTKVFPAADVLQRRGIPFMFASGYGEDGLPEQYQGWPMLQKPFGMKQLQQALESLLGDKAAARSRQTL